MTDWIRDTPNLGQGTFEEGSDFVGRRIYHLAFYQLNLSHRGVLRITWD